MPHQKWTKKRGVLPMRFTLASIFFLIGAFVFFIMWAVSSLVITEVGDALDDTGYPSEYQDIKNLLSTTFGIIAAIFFVCALLLIFILDSLADEPEMYWRHR